MNIVFILPSLSSGGLEKVITILAIYFAQQKDIQVNVICLSKGELFYPLSSDIKVRMPTFSLKTMLRPLFLIKLMYWLRKQVRSIAPDALISFGGKFNSFVLLSVYGIPVRTYISDRSSPSISYGHFVDWLNSHTYKKATGIVAQTERARTIMYNRIFCKNIRVIGNPLKLTDHSGPRDNIILNVGRFISSKQQNLLVDYFAQIRATGWKVGFIGDGSNLNSVKEKVAKLGMMDKFIFYGVVQNIEEYYKRSKIFAFTSSSEGFPNALGEAMAAGLACISYDCEAGPSDLIDDGENGFLVDEYEHEEYTKKLRLLIDDKSLRNEFGRKAKEKVKNFNIEQIGRKYLDFLTGY